MLRAEISLPVQKGFATALGMCCRLCTGAKDDGHTLAYVVDELMAHYQQVQPCHALPGPCLAATAEPLSVGCGCA